MKFTVAYTLYSAGLVQTALAKSSALYRNHVFELTVAAHFGPCGTETFKSYLSRQDGEIDKNYPQGPQLKFRDASVEPIKFFWKKIFNGNFTGSIPEIRVEFVKTGYLRSILSSHIITLI